MAVDLSGSSRRDIDLSLIDRSLGIAGIWQTALGPGEHMTTDLVVHGPGGRVLTEVRGAGLGAIEMDVLCWSLAQAVERRAGDRGKVRTSLSAIARAMYGQRELAGSDRHRIADALNNLWNAEITVTLYNEAGEPQRVVKRRVLDEFEYGPELWALEHGKRIDPKEMWLLGEDTLVFNIANWLMTRVEEAKLRVYLDWPIQRRLGTGLGKRVWVLFESWWSYAPVDGNADLEHTEIEMTEEMYAHIGARAKTPSDKRRAMKRAVQRVLEVDDCYLAETDDAPGCELIVGRGSNDVLRVVRHRRHHDVIAAAA